MRLRPLLLGLALFTAGRSLAQTTTNQANPPLFFPSPQLSFPFQAPGLTRSNAPALILPTNGPQLFLPRRRPATGPLSSLPKPGVYKSVPYTCIVVVPPPHPDDQGILGPLAKLPPSSTPAPLPQFRMPIIQPDVRLVPLTNK